MSYNRNYMKKNILSLLFLCAALSASAQDITLPAPDMSQKSMSVVEALKTRHSSREFAGKELDNQQLSNLCWAACGVSRDDNHRTSPTARNLQEIRLFAFTKSGVYEYDAKGNKLVKKADGDHRALMASNGPGAGFKQEFVMDAPVTLLMVIDFEKYGSHDDNAIRMGSVDAGNVSENINLYCQAVGLVTVPRATHDTDGLRKLLGFTDKQLPIMNNPVGYAK